MMLPHFLQLISPLVNFDEGFESQEILDAAVAVFALLLLALSLSAYRKTHIKRLLIVSAAFGLFAVEVAIRQLDAFVFAVGYQTDLIITTILDFFVLLLFFIAVVVKE
jgi:hypothetical protein